MSRYRFRFSVHRRNQPQPARQSDPTQAFVAPYVLDARRCISYLTIEHRGAIDPALADALGPWQFGCDICQSVCPWNRKAPATREPSFYPSTPYPGAERIAEMSDEQLRTRFHGSALMRARSRLWMVHNRTAQRTQRALP